MAEQNPSVDPRNTEYSIDYTDMIGRGAFGYVYKARNRFGITVAAKIIDCLKYADDEVQKCLQIRDVHPNIIDIYDYGVWDNGGKMVIFMEYCRLGNLNEYFSSKVLETKEKVMLMVQMADGLAHLHSRDIIHRDIKPANVLIQKEDDGYPTAKLSDFGLSKILEADMLSTMNSDVGTEAYKAPEFWKKDEHGNVQYKRNVDIFAAGLTYLAMVQSEGKQQLSPDVTHSLEANEFELPIGYIMYERMKNNQPVPNIIIHKGDDIVLNIKAVIRRMVHVVPEDRVTADDVLKELMKIMQCQ